MPAQSLLGQVDLAFLAAYAVGMFFAGHLGDRTDLRIFLTCGMLGSGVFCCLFGLVSGDCVISMPASPARQCVLQLYNSTVSRVCVVVSSACYLTLSAKCGCLMLQWPT